MMKAILLPVVIAIFATTTSANSNANPLFAPGEVGFDGYDLVSYFGGGPTKGSEQYETTYRGVILHFASRENLEKFVDYPDRYWPAFDGWCAISLVYDVMKKPDFTHFKIQNNRIHFFEVRAFFNGLTQWEKDPAKNEIIATVHYRNYLDSI